MNYVQIAYTIIVFYFLICWVGFLFALKPFDFFERQCKEFWFPLVIGTCLSTYMLLAMILDDTLREVTTEIFLFPCSFVFAASFVPQLSRIVRKFHAKQKEKRYS